MKEIQKSQKINKVNKKKKLPHSKDMIDNQRVKWLIDKKDSSRIHPIVFNREKTKMRLIDTLEVLEYNEEQDDDNLLSNELFTEFLYAISLNEKDDSMADEIQYELNRSQMVAVEFLVSCAETYHKIASRYMNNENKLSKRYREF